MSDIKTGSVVVDSLMTMNIQNGNIFDLPHDKYVFAHCIATDLKWGAGIAPLMMKEFNASKRWRYPFCSVDCKVGGIGVDISDYGCLVNLFTKDSTFSKPSYTSLENCLCNLKRWMTENNRHYLAIPKLGCGLDRLSWSNVVDIIRRVFSDSDITIEVRFLEQRPSYKVIIAGGRHFDDYNLVKERCNYFLSEKMKSHQVVILSGHAKGADTLGERYAQERGLSIDAHPADWEKYGKSAGFRRNAQMAEVADALIAFWDGASRGTANMIDLAKRKGLKVAVVRY